MHKIQTTQAREEVAKKMEAERNALADQKKELSAQGLRDKLEIERLGL